MSVLVSNTATWRAPPANVRRVLVLEVDDLLGGELGLAGAGRAVGRDGGHSVVVVVVVVDKIEDEEKEPKRWQKDITLEGECTNSRIDDDADCRLDMICCLACWPAHSSEGAEDKHGGVPHVFPPSVLRGDNWNKSRPWLDTRPSSWRMPPTDQVAG